MLGSAGGDYKIRVVRAKSLSRESDFEMFTMNVCMYVGNNSEKRDKGIIMNKYRYRET